MNNMKQLKENNAGFSLVEMLVAIAIFSVVSVAFFQFLMVAIRHYQQGTREVEVQYEAQLVTNQLQDMLIDAKQGVSYAVNGTLVRSDADAPAGTVTSKEVFIYNTDRYYVIEWKAADRELLYSEYSRTPEGTWDTVASDVLMAEYVSEFSVDLTFFDRNNGIGLDLLFDNEREYRVMQNVKLRNQVSVNATLAEIYGS